jgi:RimJ/RimL family protein N-acetyltransferase
MNSMIECLPPSGFSKVLPLYEAVDIHLAPIAALRGAAPARVFVDNPDLPSAALLWMDHRIYLAGFEKNERFNQGMTRLFRQIIYPESIAAGKTQYVLYFHPNNWEEVLDGILEEEQPVHAMRTYLEFKGHEQDCRKLFMPGYSLRPLDRSLLADDGLEHIEEVREEVVSEAPSQEEFLKDRFGFCALYGEDELAGWCLSEYNSQDRCEVGIATVESHRRKGIATALAGALLDHAHSLGIRRIGWHCWTDNQASVATAKRAGFELIAEFPVVYAWFDQAANLAVHGNQALFQGNFEEALDWYRQGFKTGKAPGWAYWRAACASARLGQKGDALGYLREAIERGFRYPDLFIEFDDLQELHSEAGWDEIVRSLGA